MTHEPKPEESPALKQARAKAERLAGAFACVFGQGARRSAEQKLVLDHLTLCAADEQNSYQFNIAKDGISLIAAGLHRDGAKSILRIIERQLQIAAHRREAKKEKPQTKR